MKILVINGPNLNMLGMREPHLYGQRSYQDLQKMIEDYCEQKNIEVEIFQSNHEGIIVDKIQESFGNVNGIVINPAAYTHTSIAILDALKSVGLPAIEVHISNLEAREDYRQISYIREACRHHIIGHGLEGYLEAIDYLVEVMV